MRLTALLFAVMAIAGCASPAIEPQISPVEETTGPTNDTSSEPLLDEAGNQSWASITVKGNFTTIQYFNAEYILLGSPLVEMPKTSQVNITGQLSHLLPGELTLRMIAAECDTRRDCEIEVKGDTSIHGEIRNPSPGQWDLIVFSPGPLDTGSYEITFTYSQS